MILRFDCLDNNELQTLKDVTIKDLQTENQHLRKKVNGLKNKITPLEINYNSLEQYGHGNDIKIAGVPDSAPSQNFG